MLQQIVDGIKRPNHFRVKVAGEQVFAKAFEKFLGFSPQKGKPPTDVRPPRSVRPGLHSTPLADPFRGALDGTGSRPRSRETWPTLPVIERGR